MRITFETNRFVIVSVEETLAALHGKYKLVVATKGDLLDQRKLHTSVQVITYHIPQTVRQTRGRRFNKTIRNQT
jgi:hypothetical protein